MNTWQEWVTVIVGAAVTLLIGSHQQEKNRKQKELDELRAENVELRKQQASQSERITRLESEVVSDKEVREILKEFFLPFMNTLGEIQKDVQEIKLDMAEMKGNAKEHRE